MNKPTIHAKSVSVGTGVTWGEGVTISGRFGQEAEEIVIGDHVKIEDNVVISAPSVKIGDYTVLSRDIELSGYGEASIGECCWFGRNTILNTHGDLYIGRGVGVGAYSQLWTHIRFGDTLQGCRFESTKEMIIEDDVWFVGQCLVSPIHAGRKSMALLGSVITSDMEENHIYGGAPAKDLTGKLGRQYIETTVEEKTHTMMKILYKFYTENPHLSRSIRIGANAGDVGFDAFDGNYTGDEYTVFNVSDRTYNKRNTPEEVAFMKHLLMPIKFYPREK